ncbi:DUF4339 domain-containing protein [Ancylobacter sp. VKM B-3255]|uniref:DUF4339 domain-containing protein n=2 Tax=Ancylobacter radicis TaxID=2836179 RepID=A0ABS5R4W7_9HYPH|nr:DUF4339 domain-containing protein [Ancylobacter radicis]
MSSNDFSANPPVTPTGPNVSSAVSQPPPHPLDGQWYTHMDGQVFGPFTGHQLRDFVREGRLAADTEVVRLGSEVWVKAADDGALKGLFAPRAAPSSPPPPSGPINAAPGSTVVQVTNQISEPRPSSVVILDPGAAGAKSAGVALLLSIVIVGAGQLYNGQIGKGIFMFFACILLWFVFLGWIINIWSWIDAYQTAKAMNERYLRNLAAAAAGGYR